MGDEDQPLKVQRRCDNGDKCCDKQTITIMHNLIVQNHDM